MAPVWLKVAFPAACFTLGTWQVYRWRWKERLICAYKECMQNSNLIEDPREVDEIKPMCRYKFSNPSTEICKWIGPRGGYGGEGFAYLCIVPYQLKNGQSILLNMGWHPKKQITLNTPTSIFIPDNQSEKAPLFAPNAPVKNIHKLADELGTLPVMLKRIDDPSGTSHPYSNRHLEYVFTWYTLGILSVLFGRLKR